MGRLTKPCEDTQNGKYIPHVVDPYFGIYPNSTLGKVVKKLAYYEDLEEQGRLIVLESDEDQLRTFKNKCLICEYWNGESCEKTQCPIYRKIAELERDCI